MTVLENFICAPEVLGGHYIEHYVVTKIIPH